MAIRFDALADYLYRTSSLPSMSTFTWMGWMYISVDRNAATDVFLFADAGGNYFTLGLGDDGTTLRLISPAGSTSGTNLSVTTWYHVALCRDGSTNTVYLNGSVDISRNDSTSFSPFAFLIGSNGNTSYFDGRLAAVKIWSGVALTQAEVQSEMLVIRPSKTASLYGWYPMFPGSAERSRDYSGNGYALTEGGTLTDEDPPPVSWGGSIYITQNPPADLSISVSESATTGESIARSISTLLASKTESVTVGEVRQGSVAISVSKSEAVTAGETLSVALANLAISKSDGATVNEIVATTPSTLAINKADGITTGEVLARAIDNPGVSKTEIITAQEDIDISSPICEVSQTDNALVSEIVLLSGGNLAVSVVDNALVGESEQPALSSPSVNKSESITAGEVVQAVNGLTGVSKTENVVVGEQVNAQQGGLIINASDASNIGEDVRVGIAAVPDQNAAAQDPVTVGETVAVVGAPASVSGVENVTSQDVPSVQLGPEVISVADSATVNEQVDVEISSTPALTASVLDPVTISEEARLLVPVSKNTEQAVSLGEAFALALSNPTINRADSVVTGEEIRLTNDLSINVYEPVIIGEQVNASLADLDAQVLDGVVIGEIQSNFENDHAPNVIDSATISEAILVAFFTGGQPMIARVTTVPFMGRGRKGLV